MATFGVPGVELIRSNFNVGCVKNFIWKSNSWPKTVQSHLVHWQERSSYEKKEMQRFLSLINLKLIHHHHYHNRP